MTLSQVIKYIIKSQKISDNHSKHWKEVKQLKELNQLKSDNKNLHGSMLFFIDKASSSTLVEKLATHDKKIKPNLKKN